VRRPVPALTLVLALLFTPAVTRSAADEEPARSAAAAFAQALREGDADALRQILPQRGKVQLRLTVLGPAEGPYGPGQVVAVLGDFLRRGTVESCDILRVERSPAGYSLVRLRARLTDRDGRPASVELQLALEPEDGKWVAREIRESPM